MSERAGAVSFHFTGYDVTVSGAVNAVGVGLLPFHTQFNLEQEEQLLQNDDTETLMRFITADRRSAPPGTDLTQC